MAETVTKGAHLGGEVAKALGENAGELYSDPQILLCRSNRLAGAAGPE